MDLSGVQVGQRTRDTCGPTLTPSGKGAHRRIPTRAGQYKENKISPKEAGGGKEVIKPALITRRSGHMGTDAGTQDGEKPHIVLL